MVKFLTYFLFVFSFYGSAQISIHHERAWLQDSINTHFTLQSSVFSATDTLLKSDTSIRRFSFYPDVIFSNRFNELKTQFGSGFAISGNYKDKFSYESDIRIGYTNQTPVIYNSLLQSKAFFLKEINRLNYFTADYIYTDVRAKLIYSPHKLVQFSGGIDRIFIGEGDRSLLSGNQGVSNPFVGVHANFSKLKYEFVQQIWREKFGNHFEPKGNATHYLSYKHDAHLTVGLFETVIYQMKDTLYNRGFEVEYLNPFLFFRPQEYNLGSQDNVLLGLNVSYKWGNRMYYGQLLLDDFLLSAVRSNNGWWSNKYGFQLGLKGWKTFDSTYQIFYRSEINYMRPFTYSQTTKSSVYANQGLPIAHPLGANFFEMYNEIAVTRNRWSLQAWLQLYVKGNDFFDLQNSPSYGGDIYRSYKYYVSEFKNKVGQGETMHSAQLGIQLSRIIGKQQFQSFIEPRVIAANVEGINYFNYFLSIGIQRNIGSDRRNY
jgi:hypothetical protein